MPACEGETMTGLDGAGLWLRDQPGPADGIRIFCFPHAGAGASVFRGWSTLLGPRLRVTAVQLAGREERIREPGAENLDALLDDLVPVLAAEIDRPYAMFGHSMGALVAFEAARRLQAKSLPPAWLFASAHAAPHSPYRGPYLSRLPDEDFRRAMTGLNGFPAATARDKALVDLLLPTLRADFRLCETYTYDAGELLACPLSVLGGTHDDVWQSDLASWEDLTTGPFHLRMLPGDHYYVMTLRDQLTQIVRQDLDGMN